MVDPHCQDVEMWWIHIFSVAVHINFEFIQELTLISIMLTHNISAFIHILNVEIYIAPQYIHIAPHYIHIQNVEMWWIHIASTFYV